MSIRDSRQRLGTQAADGVAAIRINNPNFDFTLGTMKQGYRLNAATGLHKGDREYQQDQVAIIPHPRVAGCLLGLVADGMGGRSGGRKASDQVIMTARQLFERFAPNDDDAAGLLRQIAEDAHLVIRLTAVAAEQEPHSTVAMFLIMPRGDCHWLHSGDSRIYHFRHGQLVRRTKDHSYVQTLVDRGELTEAQAQSHPQSNILMACLGTDDPLNLTETDIGLLAPDDVLLACSDGLWHYFTEGELAYVTASLAPREACEFLVDKARSRAKGGGDNISIAVVRVERL